MEKHYIRVTIGGINTPKGMRKPRGYLLELAKIIESELSDAAISMLIEQAKQEVSRLNKVESCSIMFNKANEEGEVVMVQLMPFKTIKII